MTKFQSLPHNDKCHGIIFRGRTSTYWNSKKNAFINTESLSLLKRSCCKCEHCNWFLNKNDMLHSDMSDSVDCSYWRKIVTEEINNGSYYQMEITEFSEYGFEYNIHELVYKDGIYVRRLNA